MAQMVNFLSSSCLSRPWCVGRGSLSYIQILMASLPFTMSGNLSCQMWAFPRPTVQQLSTMTSLCLLIQFHSGLKPHSHLSLSLDKWKIVFRNIRKILLLAVGNYIEVGTGVGPRKATTVPSIFLRPVDLFKVNHTLGKTLRSWM